MSLLDQSQQSFPTSVQVTVHQARNLRVKGKSGTNDAYAIIQVAKDKFSTCVAEKSVAPVWKEEASFDLPLFHPGNAERCTLYVIVMHRAQVGLDKFLGQAVVNLVELYDTKSRKKTDWFRLVSKDKKDDKVRGEVLLDIQFMRNNMSASMFDLSIQEKSRSRISKLKDKVRGKKKDGFSDSASAIVPSGNQILTDSEGEADAQSLSQSPQGKKKSKLKNLFGPKSNLHRNISQSMSTLGVLPEKNSSLSSSRSSGLNVDSPEGKKKFKLLGHKRTGSSDSKVSLGAFSLLGRSKQANSDVNNLCINGNHVYAEEAAAKSGSTLSLNSSGQGSMEDVRKHTSDPFADSSKSVSVPSYSHEPDKALMEQQHHQEEEMRRLAEEKRIAEAKRLDEEEKYRAEAKRLQEEEQRRQQEEQDRRRRAIEDEARRKKQKEEEEDERKKRDEERKMLEAAENQRLQEERQRAEEQKRQEEASMSDRLSSLFGILRGKEEKKEEVQPQTKVEPFSAPESTGPGQPVSRHSTNPFVDIPLSSDPAPVSPSDHQKPNHNPQTPSATMFLNRTAKVSAVKPRSAQILESDTTDCQSPSQLCPFPAHSESTLSSPPSESPETFSDLLSSLAPSNISQDPSGSPYSSTEDLSFVETGGSSPTMADQKRRPPSYPVNGNQSRGNYGPVREIQNPAYEETDRARQEKKNSLPLPDYETLFSKKRHGVQGQTKWDNLIAEVNQKNKDYPPELMGPEMSVDGPAEPAPSPRSSISHDYAAMRKFQKTKPVSSKKGASPPPPKPAASPVPQTVVDSASSSRVSRDEERNVQVSVNKEAPIAKPRQRAGGTEPKKQEESAVRTSVQTLSSSNVSSTKEQESFAQPNQFTSIDLLSKHNQDDHRKMDDDSNQHSPAFQRKNSQRGKKILPAKIRSENKTFVLQEEEPDSKEASQPFSTSDVSATLQPQTDVQTQVSLYAGEDSAGAESFYAPSSLAPSGSLLVVLEEPASQAENWSGGKTPLRAWVSPSEAQPVSTQNSNGGGLALSARRPHPVKPLNPAESQQPTNSPAVKEIKIWDTTPGKTKGGDSGSGPYSQLTQEELITLVVKQQTDLSSKNAKITELEDYIDQLLVRVIEEQPSILQALNATKPV